MAWMLLSLLSHPSNLVEGLTTQYKAKGLPLAEGLTPSFPSASRP